MRENIEFIPGHYYKRLHLGDTVASITKGNIYKALPSTRSGVLKYIDDKGVQQGCCGFHNRWEDVTEDVLKKEIYQIY